MKRVYISHPYGGSEENREKAAALAAFYRDVLAAEGQDVEIIDPLKYFEPMEQDGVDDETILVMAVQLMRDCDIVLFAPGWKHSRGCRYEHWKARRRGMTRDEIPEEVEIAAVHWYGKHHITTRRLAA